MIILHLETANVVSDTAYFRNLSWNFLSAFPRGIIFSWDENWPIARWGCIKPAMIYKNSTFMSYLQWQAESCTDILQEGVGPSSRGEYHPLGSEVTLLCLHRHHRAWQYPSHLVSVQELSSMSDKQLLNRNRGHPTKALRATLVNNRSSHTCIVASAFPALSIPPSWSYTAR